MYPAVVFGHVRSAYHVNSLVWFRSGLDQIPALHVPLSLQMAVTACPIMNRSQKHNVIQYQCYLWPLFEDPVIAFTGCPNIEHMFDKSGPRSTSVAWSQAQFTLVIECLADTWHPCTLVSVTSAAVVDLVPLWEGNSPRVHLEETSGHMREVPQFKWIAFSVHDEDYM